MITDKIHKNVKSIIRYYLLAPLFMYVLLPYLGITDYFKRLPPSCSNEDESVFDTNLAVARKPSTTSINLTPSDLNSGAPSQPGLTAYPKVL